MAAVCWTCRSAVQQVIPVFNLSLDTGNCPICLQSTSQVCVFVPCGHPVCAECSREWATWLDTWVQVPGGPAAPVEDEQAEERRRWWREAAQEVASDDESAAKVEDEGPEAAAPPPWLVPEPVPMPAATVEDEGPEAAAPPPWLVPEPVPLPVPELAPAWAPALGESFIYQGRPVHWVQLYRFWDNTVLVWTDTGLLCREGHHYAPPPAIAGWRVRWQTNNSKWILHLEVHDV